MMISTRLSLCCGFALCFLMTLAGCTANKPAAENVPAADGSTPPAATARGTIGFSALTLKNPFFKIIGDSLTEAAEKEGFKVVVNDAERDVNTQSQHIENYIAQKVAAIVINPAERVAIGPAIRKANEAGIPVFTCDLQCEAEGVEIAGHVGTNNFQGGELAGQALIEAMGARPVSKVLILHFRQANSCVERVAGFSKVIEAHNANSDAKIEIVAELEGGGIQDDAFRATSDALQAHADLDGIFAINDPSALGAWTALKQANKTDRVTIIGFDGQLEGKQAILEGKIYADPIQFPKLMGTRTVENIIRYIDGEPFEKVQLIPTELYRKADAEKDPELGKAPPAA